MNHFDNILDVYIAILYLIRHMNMLHGLQTDKGCYEKPARCECIFLIGEK